MKLLLLLLALLSTTAFAKDINLNSENTVTLRGPVTSQSIDKAVKDIKALNSIENNNSPIYLILNTPGGSVSAGIELMNYMNTVRRPVHVVVNFAASMGFHILQSSEVRYITQYGTIMSHRINGGIEGDIPQQVQSRLNHAADLGKQMDKQVISRTQGKYTLQQYQDLIRDEYWSVGETAIEDKFADEIATLKCDSSLDGTETVVLNSMFFTAELEFNKCPILNTPTTNDPEQLQKANYLLKGYKHLEF